MAWSDAARAAAAAARKAHSKAKSGVSGYSMKTYGSRLQSSVYRREMAAAVRAIRSGKITVPGKTVAGVMRDVASSTAYRNRRRK